MRSHRKVIFALFAIVVAAMATATAELQSQNQPRTPVESQTPFGHDAKVLDDAGRPIVDFQNPRPVSPNERNSRKLKNARHDKERLVLKAPNANVGEVFREPEWEAGFSDLPADKSDVMVEGIVSDSQAFLSEDRTGVYSEFTVRVSSVLKVVSGLSVNPGDTIFIERSGGKVRYPSGQVILYRIGGQGVPMVGKRYLFFLANAGQGNYQLLTGYEIEDQKVFALDGTRINFRGRGNSKFDKHNGEAFDSFMRKIALAVNSQGRGSQP